MGKDNLQEITEFEHWHPETDEEQSDQSLVSENPKVEGSNPELEAKQEIQGLDPQVAQEVLDFSDDWLEAVYYNPKRALESLDSDKFKLKDRLCSHIATIVGEKEEYEKRHLPLKYREGITILWGELIKFCAKKSGKLEEREKLSQFIEILQETLFSYSPSIANEIGTSNLLFVTAKANRIPEAQGWFGQNLVGEMVYELNWCSDETIKIIKEKVSKLSISEKIDIIHQFETLGANAAGQGWADSALDKIVKFIKDIQEETESPLVKYAADMAFERLQKESLDPSLGVITFNGNKSQGRLSEQLRQELQHESYKLQSQIQPDVTIPRGGNIIKVAADTVAITDHSNLPRFYSPIDTNELPEPEGLSRQTLEYAQSITTPLNIRQPKNMEQILHYINQEVMMPQKGDSFTPAELAQEWTKISKVIPEKQWVKYFSAIEFLHSQQQELEYKRGEIISKTETTNEELSEQFLDFFEIQAQKIIKEASGNNLPDRLSRLYEEYQEHKGQNLERSFKAAEEFVDSFRILARLGLKKDSNKQSENVKQLIYGYEQLTNMHSYNWDSAQREEESLYIDLESNKNRREALRSYLLTNQRLSRNYKILTKDTQQYLEELNNKVSFEPHKLHFASYESIPENTELNPFAHNGDEDIPLLLQHLHQPEMRARVEANLNIDFREIPLRSQIHLLKFLSEADSKTIERLSNILGGNPTYKTEFLKSFLVTAQDIEYGNQLLSLAEGVSNQETAKQIFVGYENFTEKLYATAKTTLTELQRSYPDLSLTEEFIVQGLLARGKDYLLELNSALKKGQSITAEQVETYSKELLEEAASLQVIRTQFKDIASLLDRQNIDLATFGKQQELVLRSLLTGESRGVALRTLARMDKLEPIPEIHWRVDRNLEEYNRRLGVDVSEFLTARALQSETGKQQILLEIGPGSGASKQERANANLNQHYQDYALSDRIYYPLAGVFEKLIDFEGLEKATQNKLSAEDRKQLADFLYKALVIARGQTEKDLFDYDQPNQKLLVDDINNLKLLLPELAERLRSLDTVPSTISTRDSAGNVIYPYKEKVSEFSPALQKAKTLLDQDFNQYLQKDWEKKDFYELIDAFPANTMIGDIKDLNRLKDNQVDVEMAIRSTVYSRGEDYVNFLTTLSKKLAKGGIAMDDSIRDNDGWYYRLAEIMEAKSQMPNDLEILVVLGPGFEGEDTRQDRVPLAILMTKSGSSQENLQQYLLDGYEVVPLEELVQDTEYLSTLDKTGLTAQKVREII